MPRYTAEMKRKIINEHISGVSSNELAKKYGLARSSVTLWTRQFKTNFQSSKSRREYLAQQELERLRTDNQIFKECGCSLSASLAERMAAVLRLQDRYSIHSLCRVLNVRRSLVYYYNRRAPKEKVVDKEDLALKPLIAEIFEKGRHVLGAKRIKPILLEEAGYIVSVRRISRLMKELGLKVDYISVYPYPKRKSSPLFPNLLQRQFNPDAPNKIWVSDITMIYIGNKKMFLCSIMDLYARKIISYTLFSHMHANLVIDTLAKAYITRGCPEGVIFHSDQGSQYTSYEVRSVLEDHNIAQSFSNPGCPHDNAVAEAFFARIKEEFIHRFIFEDEIDFRMELQEYFKFYNDYRPHSHLKYLTPNRAEEVYYRKHTEKCS